MSVLLFILFTVIVGITTDYFIRRKKKISYATQPQVNQLSPSKIIPMVPPGVFIQPSFTWSKILDSGNLMLGVHPILLGLIGKPEKFEKLPQGQHVNKGDTFITLQKDSKRLNIKSPVNGTIESINLEFDEGVWENMGTVWLYCIKPENLSSEFTYWFLAEKSKKWINQKIEQIKTFLNDSLSPKQVGLTIADGGELSVGVLSQFDNKIWQDFESKFLAS